MRQNKWLLRLGYIFLGLSLFLIFFYATFPFHLAQKKIAREFEIASGCQTEVKDATVLFPLRLQWHKLRVLCPHSAEVVLDSMEASIAVLPLLKQRGEIDFKIKIADGGGDITGTLIADRTPEGIALAIKKGGAGVGVHINYRGFSGILDARGDGRWIGQDVVMGNGVFNFNVKDAHFKNQAMSWPMSDISFGTMTGKVSWKTGVISIGHFSAEGETALLMSRGGSLILHEPFSESFLSININVSPKGQLAQVAELMISGYKAREPLQLDITGPLTAPKILLNGRRLPTGS
jgi:type II secretion system protein N